MTPITASTLFNVFAFIVGACIGSFLNVVIYRLPLGLSVNEPRRSFCPRCKTTLPFYENFPCISWLTLRGKCAHCGGAISFRYFAVELLTGLLFLFVWLQCDRSGEFALVLPLWVLLGLLVSATFIDFDHFIIPDEITVGGTVAGLLFSFAFPSLMSEESHWKSLLWSLAGAACGFAILWAVVELGKLAFGKRKLKFEPPLDFRWTRQGDDADFAVGEETMRWSEIFSRESDQLVLEGLEVRVDENPPAADSPEAPQPAASEGDALPQPAQETALGSVAQPQGETTLRFFYNRLLLAGRESEPVALDSLASVIGKVRRMIVPREAMGFGDVKFIACIGAFLGWKAVLFTIISASLAGSIVGVALLVLGRREASGRIPFGPYLALGALLWVFSGPAIVAWYLARMMPEGM